MNPEVRQIKKKRTTLVALDKIHGLVREKIGEVTARRIVHFRIRDEVKMAAHGDNSLVEAAFGGMIIRS